MISQDFQKQVKGYGLAARGAPPPRDKEARSRQAEMSERADALALPSGGDRAVFGLAIP